MKYFKIISLLITLFSVNAFSGDADQLLKNVRDKYNKLNDFSAGIMQEGKNPALKGIVYYKKENKFYFDLNNMAIISDGETVWNHNKKANKVIINDAVSDENSIFSFKTLLEVYPSKCSVSTASDGNLNILILSPNAGSGFNFKEARLWVNQENLVEKVAVTMLSSDSFEFRFSNYKLNRGIPDSRFVFKIPKGSSIIDLR